MSSSPSLQPPTDHHLLQLAASYAPRYVQLYIQLRERLLLGETKTLDLRTRTLAAEYGVSRAVVIGALQMLARERIIIRRQGRPPKLRPKRE